jgi:hypothetical protein
MQEVTSRKLTVGSKQYAVMKYELWSTPVARCSSVCNGGIMGREK